MEEYGCGFSCDFTDEKLIDFIICHKESFCKTEEETNRYERMLKYMKSDYDLEDFFEDYPCDANAMEGNGAVIANIMTRETGIKFEYFQPDDNGIGNGIVVFSPCYPWQLNDKEKNLSEEELIDILQKYMAELNIFGLPGHKSVIYHLD